MMKTLISQIILAACFICGPLKGRLVDPPLLRFTLQKKVE